MAEYPAGTIPVIPAADPLADNRSTYYTFGLYDRDENFKKDLEGVGRSGQVQWRRDARIKGGGQITLTDLDEDIDWLNDRIRPTIHVNGTEWNLGMWIPTAPVAAWKGTHRTWSVDLHDKLVVPDEDVVTDYFSLASGADVFEEVLTLLTSTGEANYAATDLGVTLDSARLWEPGTPKLTIINNLLDASGYFTLRMDANGTFLIQPYTVPTERNLRYSFLDGPASIYSDEFTRGYDNFKVPNRVVALTDGDEFNPGLTSTAENDDPTSIYSFTSRGRWVTKVYTSVDAYDQSSLDSWALRKLAEWATPNATETFTFAPIPLDIYDAIRFRNTPAGIDVRATVESVTIPFNGTQLASAEVREVATIETAA